MAKIKRGRFTISVNILMTTSLITRAFTFGFVMMCIYITTGDKILNEQVIKVVNSHNINGIPYGTAVYCLVFSLIGVFVVDMMTGIFGLYGTIRKNKYMLVVNSAMSLLLIIVYVIYIVLFSIVYDELGCNQNYDTSCYDVYIEKLASYVHTYFGMFVTCIICQGVSIVAVEYLYRKMELKKKNEKISDKKYWILCTSQHGIFRNCLVFIRNSFRKSKWVFISALIKLASLMMGIGLLVLGLAIVGHEFITNYRLRGLFYRLQFHNLYLYDVITGVSASSIVLGIATITIAIFSLMGSWRKSKRLLLTSTVLSLLVQIPRIVTLFMWIVFQAKIDDELQLQLGILQSGYYFYGINELTTEWNNMIQVLNCCGVNSPSDTHYSDQKRIFCYDNAIEISAYPSESYTNTYNLQYAEWTGKFRNTTCTNKIHWIIQMMIGWFLAITILQLLLEIVGIIFVNKEFKNCNAAFLQQIGTNHENGNATEEKHIMLFMKVEVKKFLTNTWQRSKITFLCMSSAAVIILMSFGLLVVALDLRYDSVFGNRYVNEYIFDDIMIAGRSLGSSIKSFNIVVTTFSLVSFFVAIYAFIVTATAFRKRYVMLYLVIFFMGFLFIANVILIVLWGIHNSQVSDYLTSEMKLEMNKAFLYLYTPQTDAWNTLLIKGQCCGAENLPSTMYIYCCKSETILYPYDSRTNTDCTNRRLYGTFYDTVCDEAIKTRLNKYSILFFVLMAIISLSQVICIITTVHLIRRQPRIEPCSDRENDKVEQTTSEVLTNMDDKNSMNEKNKDESMNSMRSSTEIFEQKIIEIAVDNANASTSDKAAQEIIIKEDDHDSSGLLNNSTTIQDADVNGLSDAMFESQSNMNNDMS